MDNSLQFDPQQQKLICQGDWTLNTIAGLESKLKKITWPRQGAITIDGSGIKKMDSSAAWLFSKLTKTLSKKNLTTQLTNFSDQHQKLIKLINEQIAHSNKIPHVKSPNWLARLGESAVGYLIEARDFLSFTGQLAIEALRIVRRPKHLRWSAIASTIERTGFQALPIIALLSFMIGVVLTYQMGLQLQNYGANIFIVDLLGLAVLREFAPLLTAIMVAGRTGAAFTAQLGTMKINEEIDALNTMSVTPAELLLLPRLGGLVIALPLLTIWSDIFGILGGMFMSKIMLGIPFMDFLDRFGQQISLSSLLIGLGKAPVFALLIASIGCFQGMQVAGSADSVGKQTTKSVVQAIFFIIVADAIFSVLLSELKL